jgi:hypothetical protein
MEKRHGTNTIWALITLALALAVLWPNLPGVAALTGPAKNMTAPAAQETACF